MALSPQYSWPEPDNSSLVKNGAQDIRALGDAIDTSVWNVGYGQAGKNKIINGDMSVWQRSASQTTTVSDVFLLDRFFNTQSDGTCTFSVQTFTPGAAPVAGYEAKNYLRMVTSGQTITTALARIDQKIEDVRTFAGQTITVSFWAQAGTGTPSIAVELQQNFGTGGSPSATVNTLIASPAKQAISTSWVRYSYTIAVPSISGKTLGTNNNSFLLLGIIVSAGSFFDARTGSLGIQSNTFNIWGVQAEYGSKATPFQTASGGSPQAELAMCQRYYYRIFPNGTQKLFGVATAATTTAGGSIIYFPVKMRTAPTALEQSGTANEYAVNFAGVQTTCSAVPTFQSFTTDNSAFVTVAVTAGLIAGQAGRFVTDITNGTNAYLGWSAEL